MIELAQALPSPDGDERWVVRERGDVLADLTLWWNGTPLFEGSRTGFIGRYAANDRSHARRLLEHALTRLAANGCELAVGPIDGNTWHGYRFVIETSAEPPFFLEPHNPVEWPQDFRSCGFEMFAAYASYRDVDLRRRDPRIERLQGLAQRQAVTIRELDTTAFDRELDAIYGLCITAFARNLLYSDIEPAAFHALYAQVRPLIDQRLCLLAEHDGSLVAFAFALPNRLDASGTSAIVKTIARLPENRYAGLGALISDRIRLAIHDAGYASAIHALMHESNASLAISRRFARPIRRYALFSRALP